MFHEEKFMFHGSRPIEKAFHISQKKKYINTVAQLTFCYWSFSNQGEKNCDVTLFFSLLLHMLPQRLTVVLDVVHSSNWPGVFRHVNGPLPHVSTDC